MRRTEPGRWWFKAVHQGCGAGEQPTGGWCVRRGRAMSLSVLLQWCVPRAGSLRHAATQALDVYAITPPPRLVNCHRSQLSVPGGLNAGRVEEMISFLHKHYVALSAVLTPSCSPSVAANRWLEAGERGVMRDESQTVEGGAPTKQLLHSWTLFPLICHLWHQRIKGAF